MFFFKGMASIWSLQYSCINILLRKTNCWLSDVATQPLDLNYFDKELSKILRFSDCPDMLLA